MKLKQVVLAALVGPAAFSVWAGQVTITPMAGYHVFDNKLDKLTPPGVDDDFAYGGALGYRFTKNLSAELGYIRTEADRSNTSGDARSNLYSLDGMYRFNADGRFQPYLLLGAGHGRLKVDGTPGEAKDTLVNGGVGAFVEFTDHFRLRTELRAVYNTDESYTDGLALVGLEMAMGSFDEPRRAVAPAPEPRPVEPAPRPRPAPVVAPAPDSDGDGVPDARDKCPGTPAGALVDADGCPKILTETISREVKVLFDSSKAVIKPEYRGEVEEVAKLMKQYPSAVAEIQGHTDSSGSQQINSRLSQERANAVRSMLVNDFGIDAGRIDAKGYGSSQPVASNKTAEGKAKNRRVIAIITGERQKVQMKKKR